MRSRETYDRASSDGRRDPGLLLLISLAAGPKHGYAVMEDVAAFAGVRLGPGTLYGALARLERDGLVEPVDSDDRRRPYRLTKLGSDRLRAQLEGFGQLVQIGRRRLATR